MLDQSVYRSCFSFETPSGFSYELDCVVTVDTLSMDASSTLALFSARDDSLSVSWEVERIGAKQIEHDTGCTVRHWKGTSVCRGRSVGKKRICHVEVSQMLVDSLKTRIPVNCMTSKRIEGKPWGEAIGLAFSRNVLECIILCAREE